ncbi:hypothetical protein CcrC1_gp528 [Caulobacter phage C1]|nr:hypothetical protein CcrC1_gp035 [Caulobacter phage C1]UTU08262.1 hypothetical protein CcrC2_gp034 [Caulobacter phage C2]UTU08785.1 hypothetical protein CcrJ4_gp034 [Caulobacter phage J4]UTU09897.1 hypothetical protein CcrRB23_gp035 [Caulobacter phage RB23]WGN97449.1 hypothetical protein [Bertelyvirus sp.]
MSRTAPRVKNRDSRRKKTVDTHRAAMRQRLSTTGTPAMNLEDWFYPSSDISNSDQTIDSRDVIKRVDELQAAFDDAEIDPDQVLADDELDLGKDAEEIRDAAQELKALKDFAEEGENYAADWTSGETLIRESYFVEYAEQLCKDIGDLPDNIPGYLAIDWEKTANNIKADYSEIEFDGVTYLVR